MTPPPLAGNSFPTILLVEVDADRRLALADILRRDGYLVLEAEDISRAIAVARTHSRIIHLLLVSDALVPSLPALLRRYRRSLHVLTLAGEQNGLVLKSVGCGYFGTTVQAG